ncbi:hypothetical protein [uncultured Clostridium sp.]|uniref:hypothetical protein n=1 Tax=uncultured Clostridium sp. TaxID=59620 RepID=UPI00261A80C1|nr:hypothetical protein [uncultured Clostridium sp.]
MSFFEGYIKESIKNGKCLFISSLKIGGLLSFITSIIKIILGQSIDIVVVGFLIMTIIFSMMGALIIRQMNKLVDKKI